MSAPSRPIVQIGYAVQDIRVAALRFSQQTGAGPFFARDHFEIATASHGRAEATFDHSAAFGQWGGVMVELIAQHRVEPAALAEILRPERSGVHHMTWLAADLEVESSRLESSGWPCVLDVTTAAGVRFVFHDARAELGHLIEMYEPSPRVLGHYEAIAAAALDWDGSNPVREASEL
jgi:hypothetical protein